VKTSSESSRSAMRAEYLAEFEAAGIRPPADLPLRHEGRQAEIALGASEQVPSGRVRKIILPPPGATRADLLASDFVAIGGGLFIVLRIAVMALVAMGALVAGMLAAERRGRRRGGSW
jgi:hypothetical protein